MKKIDKFILQSFLGPFAITFAIAVFIFVMQFLWVYIDDLVGKGLSFWVILEFLGWASATILPYAMPLATLISSIMTLGSLGENNELLAMKAAGISLQRILYPLIYVAIAISISAFFVSNNLIPISWNKIYTLQYDIGRTKEEIKIPTGTFYNGIEGYSLRIESRNPKTSMMYNVMVYNHTANKGNIALAVADSGSIKSTPDKSALIFTLYHGSSYEENNQINYIDTSLVLQKIDFYMQEIIIPLENYAFKKSDSEIYGDEVMSKDLAHLLKDRDSLGAIHNELYIDHQSRVVYGIGIVNASQLDTSRNMGYVNSIRIDSLPKSNSAKDALFEVSQAIVAAETAIATMKTYDTESQQYTFFLRRIDIESYRKFTLSFACLIFFFIGAPLGAIIRKGGLGTPVIVSALFFVLYWVIDITGKKLARDGVITPALGAFISSIVLLPIGIFLTWKSTKDSSLFNLDSYILPIKGFFNKISLKRSKNDKG